MMSYSSESCMVSREQAEKIRSRQTIAKGRMEDVRALFEKVMQEHYESKKKIALYKIALDYASK